MIIKFSTSEYKIIKLPYKQYSKITAITSLSILLLIVSNIMTFIYFPSNQSDKFEKLIEIDEETANNQSTKNHEHQKSSISISEEMQKNFIKKYTYKPIKYIINTIDKNEKYIKAYEKIFTMFMFVFNIIVFLILLIEYFSVKNINKFLIYFILFLYLIMQLISIVINKFIMEKMKDHEWIALQWSIYTISTSIIIFVCFGQLFNWMISIITIIPILILYSYEITEEFISTSDIIISILIALTIIMPIAILIRSKKTSLFYTR